MTYKNPIISGFYPDPSVCKANGKYYLVCSSFEYFPGVPLFESTDLVNWRQIGNVLTRESQLPLGNAYASGGIYAPTIREDNGRFYMVTTNINAGGNFYVYTDDIYGEWSEPIYVNQSGIDPTIYFEDGKAYFISNGNDESRGGLAGIQMSEINIETGEILTPSRYIWYGSGGRYVEAPHIYKRGGRYYLMTAEGGTEYGHMVTYAVSDSLWGEYKTAPNNPVLTNRNLGGYPLQAVGHGDLTEDDNGSYWMVHLGFRTPGNYINYHHLGRETFLTPVTFNADGTFTAGENGTASLEVTTDRLPETLVQTSFREEKNFIYLRNPCFENYEITNEKITLHGTEVTIDDVASPTFIGLRQKEFNTKISANVRFLTNGNAGITLYMNEKHHYDIELEKTGDGICVCTLLNIGDVKDYYVKCVEINTDNAELRIEATDLLYRFFVNDECIAEAQTRYLSTEVAGGFTGVIIGLYAENGDAEFTDFKVEY
jgi:alpha-N-arabinofuranosidase